jgi:chromosomal replication initiation ATPase DnaA
LYGSSQCGKTHLSNIWLKRAEAKRFLYQDRIDVLDNFSNILVEDIDDLNWTEEDLLHIFNFCHETKKYCLFTSKKFPLNFTLADLDSRIKSIDRVNIGRPDKEMIKIILRKEFSEKSLQVEQKLIDLLAEVIPLNFAAARDAVNLVDKTSLTKGKTINYSLIKKLFLNY